MQKFNVSGLKGKNVLLLCHESADLDSFCSAAMMQEFLESKGIKSKIAVPSHINDQALHFAFKNKISFEMNPSIADFDFVLIFDLNDFNQLGHIKKQFTSLCAQSCFRAIIFDHHQPKKQSISCAVKALKAITNKDCVSTTHLLYNIFAKDPKNSKNFSAKMAFYACIGMVEDTGRFLVGSADSFAAFADCLTRSKKTYEDVLAFAKHEIPEGERIAFLKAAQRAQITKIGDIIVISSELSFFQSHAATKLMEFGAHISLVAGAERGGVTTLAARADSVFKEKVHFNLMRDLMVPLQEKLGGNPGGHSGAAIWKGKADEKVVLAQALSILKKFIEKK